MATKGHTFGLVVGRFFGINLTYCKAPSGKNCLIDERCRVSCGIKLEMKKNCEKFLPQFEAHTAALYDSQKCLRNNFTFG